MCEGIKEGTVYSYCINDSLKLVNFSLYFGLTSDIKSIKFIELIKLLNKADI
jgi:hypothetical protein